MSPSSSRYWPGTKVPRSTGGPFDWRRTDHADMSPIITDDHGMRTPLFNQWLAARRARPERTAMQGSALQGTACHRITKQRGSPTGNSGFSGPFWSEGCARSRSANQCIEGRRIASHRTDVQGKAAQSNADCPLATVDFPGRFGPNASQGIAMNRTAQHRTASRCKATQSNADRPLATVDFPGRFGSPGRVSSAALSTD